MTLEPTPREWKAYDFCAAYAREHGHGPTMDVLAGHLKIHPNNACNVAAALERKGLIKRAGKAQARMQVFPRDSNYRLRIEKVNEEYAAAVAVTVPRL